MHHPATRLGLLVLLVLPGCGGCRVSRYGFGTPAMRIHRGVWAKADWSPDDQFVLVAATRTKRVIRARYSIVAYGALEDEPYERHAIYRVRADGSERPVRLGDGQGLEIAPAGTWAAFAEELDPPEEGQPPPRRLWLADYAARRPRPVKLGDGVLHYSFSHDGKWLAWSSAEPASWRVVAVDRPDQPHDLSAALVDLRKEGWTARRWGMPRDRWRWSADGSLYRLLTRWGPDRTSLIHRWVRYVPPDWTPEDLGRFPKDVEPESLRDEPRRRPHGLARSLDGNRTLHVETDERIRGGLAYAVCFPSRTSSVANVFIAGPGRSRLQLTHFTPRR